MNANRTHTQKEIEVSTTTFGYCKKCAKIHRLSSGNSIRGCRELIDSFLNDPTASLVSLRHKALTPFALSGLFGPSCGKMFGVMECLCPDGSITFLKAFSGQLNGIWEVDGWVPPLFDVKQFERISCDTEKEIKALGRKIDRCTRNSEKWSMLRKKRRTLSQELMHKIHSLYRLTNFNKETATLAAAYTDSGGIPTGTGDCCAPKLLNFAAKNNLKPLGIKEFYWGKENKSKTRQHGTYYSSCSDKCQPILGFLLCGLQ